ncbi:MAG: deoxynucleoside kinase [Pseudomonadota bacterium]
MSVETRTLPHRFIVVEGPIGVGKTTLARRLTESFGGELVRELADENPFLERFYRDPRTAALPTQLFFLFQRARQISALRQSDMFAPLYVSDFMFEKDRLFAQLLLDEEEYKLYDQVFNGLAVELIRPDLVIYLQAPVEVLQKRIAKRGIAFERHITDDYLARLNNAYTSFFYSYQGSPLLIVNAAEIDFADNEKDYNLLLEQICAVRNGRRFFNPIPMKWS